MAVARQAILSLYSPAGVGQTEVGHITPSASNDTNNAEGGETNSGQLVPFTGGTQLTLAPESERNVTCIVSGNDRLDSAPCTNDDSQVFKILA